MKTQKPTPAIIMVRPQMGENIGAAARAMLNFGFTDLRLVAPRDGWPNSRAFEMASGALERFEPRLFDTLGEALADCHHSYATTARMRDMEKAVVTPVGAAQEYAARAQAGQRIAFVFGPERTGLENDEIALCHEILNVPTNPDFSSLNLGQSVLLLCYQCFIAQGSEDDFTPPTPAPQADFDALIGRLEEDLEARRYFRTPDLKPSMMRNIRAMFMRSGLTEQEIKSFHGIISALIGNKMQD